MALNRSSLAVNVGCLALSGALLGLSLGGSMPSAYLFPKIIALVMLGLAAAIAISEWRRIATPADELSAQVPWRKLWPALLIIGVYLPLLNRLGFYTSSLLMFFVGVAYYTPKSGSVHRFVVPAAIAVAFIAFVYIVFALLLRVLPPTGLLI